MSTVSRTQTCPRCGETSRYPHVTDNCLVCRTEFCRQKKTAKYCSSRCSSTAKRGDTPRALLREAQAELYAIRRGVDQLLAGPWVPTPDAIREAVFEPSEKLIDEYKANKEVGW